jgi:N-acyl-D-aspartate/D-glutamate deacylase
MNFIGQNETTEFNANWEKFSDFSKKVSSIKIGTNMACLVGHNTLRSSIMGLEGEGGERPVPTECELNEMKKSLTQSYRQGVFGLSTGLGYPVGRNSLTSEIIELCEITSKK